MSLFRANTLPPPTEMAAQARVNNAPQQEQQRHQLPRPMMRTDAQEITKYGPVDFHGRKFKTVSERITRENILVQSYRDQLLYRDAVVTGAEKEILKAISVWYISEEYDDQLNALYDDEAKERERDVQRQSQQNQPQVHQLRFPDNPLGDWGNLIEPPTLGENVLDHNDCEFFESAFHGVDPKLGARSALFKINLRDVGQYISQKKLSEEAALVGMFFAFSSAKLTTLARTTEIIICHLIQTGR